MRARHSRVTALAAAALSLLAVGARATASATPSVLSCDTAAGDPNPQTQTLAWEARDRNDQLCASQRQQDEAHNPAFLRLSTEETASGPNPFGELNDPRPRGPTSVVPAGGDPFRLPSRWVGLGRGQYQPFSFVSSTGAKLSGALFSPNPRPGARYPIVTFTPGLQEAKEQAWWFDEGLAEAGYIVLTFDPQGQGASETTARKPDGSLDCSPGCPGFPTDDMAETRAAIAFAVSTPKAPYRYAVGANAEGTLRYNPLWREVNRKEVGIAGHSLGAIAVTPIGQADPRVKAVVSYDNLDGSIPAGIVPKIHAPALYFATDYPFPTFATPMNPNSPPVPHKHWPAFNQTRHARVDSMVVVPRASTHYEWDEVGAAPGWLPASRYGEIMSFYYTLGWFDRYLKHERSAVARLTRLTFDRSADAHAIGAGTFDPALAAADPANPYAGNVPYRITGKCVADLLSFYYASAYWLDGGRLRSTNMRDRGCPGDHRR